MRRRKSRRVLIANRDDAALRAMRTFRRMGIETIAVYSEADGNALHVRMADHSVRIGGSSLVEDTYGNIERILWAAKETGASLIWPGWGFLSENWEFFQACEEKGVKVIGPTSEVVRKTGNKLIALEAATSVAVPTLKRSGLISASLREKEEIERIAEDVGYPLMIKALEEGGGRGIKFVLSQRELLLNLEKSRAQSRSGAVYFEHCADNSASHLEVQILADEHEKVLHFLGRDCTIQRSHQKVIEEGPITKLEDSQLDLLYMYSLKVAKAMNYTNVGTMEFLVWEDQTTHEWKIFFIEINPRLQVEHGVTEMITRLRAASARGEARVLSPDLIEIQTLIAEGRRIPFSQEDVTPSGHAIEARMYPEVPQQDRSFVRNIGKVTRLKLPPEEATVRFDSALCEGYEIAPYYDPLMGKVIAWGATRKEACGRLENWLAEMEIRGVETNIPFLRAVLRNGVFSEGAHTLKFLENQEVWKELEREMWIIGAEELNKRLWENVERLV